MKTDEAWTGFFASSAFRSCFEKKGAKSRIHADLLLVILMSTCLMDNKHMLRMSNSTVVRDGLQPKPDVNVHEYSDNICNLVAQR